MVPPHGAAAREDTLDAQHERYDLEQEVPGDESAGSEYELEDVLEALTDDSLVVEDVSIERPPEIGYDIGYRIQVFASGDIEKAEAVRREAALKTGLPSYIAYEDGLYKVRVGDFTGRQSADGARAELMNLYPDCWIVQTTIRK